MILYCYIDRRVEMETYPPPVMEAPPPETVDPALIAEAEEVEARIEMMRQIAASKLGKEAMVQAGMPEFLISDNTDQMGNPPMTFIEHGIARIALGGF